MTHCTICHIEYRNNKHTHTTGGIQPENINPNCKCLYRKTLLDLAKEEEAYQKMRRGGLEHNLMLTKEKLRRYNAGEKTYPRWSFDLKISPEWRPRV